jgi:hypothetical protein
MLASTTIMPRDRSRPGDSRVPGRERGGVMLPSRGDGYYNTAEAARLVRRKPCTIRRWRHLGYLRVQGLDERGFPLHTAEAVREAERTARANGLRTRKIDPRQQAAAASFPLPAVA